MGWIKELGDIIKNLADLEKVGILCFMIIIILLIISKIEFTLTLVLYSFGIIILFLHAGLHKVRSDRLIPHPTNPKRTVNEHTEGYDFTSVLKNKHPYNTIRKISYFFLILGTISFIIEIIICIK